MFSNYEQPKYFFYNYSFAFKWSLFVLSNIILNRYSLLIPLGNANGCGCLLNTLANGDVSNNSYLYDYDTVPQLSHVINGHLDGLITKFYQYGSIK